MTVDGDIEGMKSELPTYLAAAEDVSPQTDPCEWWKHHSADIPIWARVFRKVALIQPSSAAAECFHFSKIRLASNKNNHGRLYTTVSDDAVQIPKQV